MRFELLLPVVLALTLAACGNDDDDQGPGDDDDASHGDDDDTGAGDDDAGADPETDCFDGEDNDHDGQIDCADSDCAAEFECTWPGQMQHQARFQFISESVLLDDCETRFESLLVKTTQGDVCAQCDRSYGGQYQYSVNTCADLLEAGGVDLPDQGMYGVVFVSDYEREIFTRNTEGQWEAVGIAAKDDGVGHYILSRHDDADGWGVLVTELTFTDL
jgi:hypothetical protein